jgi:hypothetical protein
VFVSEKAKGQLVNDTNEKIFLVVTSIAEPNEILKQLACGCNEYEWGFVVIGDEASPDDFRLEGCDFYSLERQKQVGLDFAEKCPTRHYARKNIGYLMAAQSGASIIIETDDDNIPLEGFWQKRNREQEAAVCVDAGWVNVYKYFSKTDIWPRGYPLNELARNIPAYESMKTQKIDCPIQQNLADDNPDVDAVYRLVLPLPVKFDNGNNIALSSGSFCPFNSQNTTWWPKAYELMYLPAYCSFRMTDIWRSFVAQRIAYVNGWSLLFAGATMRQDRNVHDLMRDFEDEVPGYLNNKRIVEELGLLNLSSGEDKIADNMRICYEKLVEMSLVGTEELSLLDAWLGDMRNCQSS